MPVLLALFGPKQGLRIPLLGRLLLGRGTAADLQLPDGKVSREHCRIDATGVRPTIKDLGSHNGTHVNGERIACPTWLSEGDEIAVGDTLFLVGGNHVELASARYGSGMLLISGQGRASTAANPGPPLPAHPTDGLRGLDRLARRLAETRGEEDTASAILDAIESELAPKRATLLLRLWQGDTGSSKEKLVALGTRGKEAVVSISRALFERVGNSRRGVLVEDTLASRELRGSRSVLTHSLRSVMVVPWGNEEGGRGFIQVDRGADRSFALPDLAWLEAVGHLATLRLGERAQAASVSTDEGPIGGSPAFASVLGLAAAAAHDGSTVLLLGEPGTGKEDVARLIHNHSRQGRGPFVSVNCATLSESLAETVLFGHEKGAPGGATSTRLGAFELADGGTLFLSEIGDLAPSLQVRLLRTLRERAVTRVGSTTARPIDVRLVAASHRDLAADVNSRLLHEDLHLYLKVVTLALPTLRERREDIPRLARVLLDRAAARLGLQSPGLTPDAEAALSAWEYPGNVRELANVLERVLVLRDPRDPKAIDRADVMAALGIAMRPMHQAVAAALDERLSDALARAERQHIEATLRRARGVKTHAARMLGISRPTLDKKIAELGIELWAPSPADE